MVEKLKAHTRWLRIALLLSFVVGLLATMAGETLEQKFLMGALFSAVLGLLWAALLYSVSETDSSDWDELAKNVAEAQTIINQSTYSAYRRKMFGLQPKPNIESMDILETLKSPVSICLFFTVSVILGFHPNFLDYVFVFKQQNPPMPKTLLLYLGFIFCLSTAFLGIFLCVRQRVQKTS